MVGPPIVACVLIASILQSTPTAAQVPNGGPINALQGQVTLLRQQVADRSSEVRPCEVQR